MRMEPKGKGKIKALRELLGIYLPRIRVNKLTMHLAARLQRPNGNKKSLIWVMPARPSACYVRSIHYARERERVMERRGRRALVSDSANTQFPPRRNSCPSPK